jgi:hypothetical protein
VKRTSSKSKWVIVVLGLGLVSAVLYLDWRPAPPLSPPRLEKAFAAEGPLMAGAAKVELSPALPAVVAGYPPPRSAATRSTPLFARAVVLQVGSQALGIVSVEVLEIPGPLADQVRERGRALGLADVIVTATHTHSSFGGYDANPLAQWAATGRYRQAIAEDLAAKLVKSLAEAQKAMTPAVSKIGRAVASGLQRNRGQPGAPVESELIAVALDAKDERPIARLILFGCHATLVGRSRERLDGDWPGRAMAAVEAEEGAVALLLQGALGDVSPLVAPEETLELGKSPDVDKDLGPEKSARLDAMAARIAKVAREATAGAAPDSPSMAFASVTIDLPPAEATHAVPGYLRRPAANLLSLVEPRSASLSALRLGWLQMLFAPAEPTVGAAAELKARLGELAPESSKMAVVGLAQGYLGYLETEPAVRQGVGEAKRTLFGPSLLARIGDGLAVGMKSLPAAPRAHRTD